MALANFREFSRGLGDKAFNDGAFAGLQMCASDFGMSVQEISFQDGDAQTEAVRQLANEGYDLIIGLGAENSAPSQTVAGEFPALKFAMIDTTADAANVTSVVFRELEGDFLAGALTALLSESGVEVSYAAAGRTGLGAIDAAKAAGQLIITTGSDQRWIAPEVVVTSRTKNMDAAVLGLCQNLQAGTLAAGTRELDYNSGGIGLAPLDGGLVPADAMEEFAKIQSDVESGKILPEPYSG